MADPASASADDLLRRLQEAEETISAIQEGKVDALVLRGNEQDEVFSLVSDGGSYRSFMEVMETGAAALDDQKRLLYANGALCELLRVPAAELQKRGLSDALGDDAGRVVDGLVAAAAKEKQTAQIQISAGAHVRHVMAAAAPLPLNFGQGYALTFTDVTDRVEAAAAAESERVGQAVMASAGSAVVVCDAQGIITHANMAVRAVHDGNPVGRSFAEAFPLEFALGAGFIEPADVVAVGIAGNSVKAVEAALMRPSRVQDVLVSVAPLRLSAGAVSGCAITMIDMTERKAVEKRQVLLMRELDHRVKNTLTLVLSIASRTVNGAVDLPDFHRKFTRRIEALAATHNLLAEGSWRRLTLEEVVTAELSPYVASGGPRVNLVDVNFRVSPDTAIALGLVFHELVTNAVKYGALSNDSGSISLTGQRLSSGNLELIWRERGGPRVEAPTRKGFGQTLIARSLGSSGGAGTSVEFHPEGVVCRMQIPSSEIETA